jgi:Alternative complex III, ActD subunit
MSQTSDPAILIAQIKDKLGIGDDKVYAVMGDFAEPEDLVEAGRRIRAMGYTKIDAMTPFPVHGIDEAIGVPYSKIGWIAVCGALAGITTAQVLIYYVGKIDYPLIIGGKPLFDFTYSIPPTFELGVLFTAITTFLCTWGLSGLPRLYHPSMNYRNMHRSSDDRFLLVVEADDPKFDAQKTAQDMRSVGANDVEVVEG